MPKKQEVEMTDNDAMLLHVVGEHLAMGVARELHTAAYEANSLLAQTKDERFKETLDLVEQILGTMTDRVKELLETIPGVIVPSKEEIRQMIEDAQAEKEFMQLIASKEEVLH